jgi:hypothetical protein
VKKALNKSKSMNVEGKKRQNTFLWWFEELFSDFSLGPPDRRANLPPTLGALDYLR